MRGCTVRNKTYDPYVSIHETPGIRVSRVRSLFDLFRRPLLSVSLYATLPVPSCRNFSADTFRVRGDGRSLFREDPGFVVFFRRSFSFISRHPHSFHKVTVNLNSLFSKINAFTVPLLLRIEEILAEDGDDHTVKALRILLNPNFYLPPPLEPE